MDFSADEPIEIIKHLMIGSEGTLGFVSQATYNTVPEWPNKVRAALAAHARAAEAAAADGCDRAAGGRASGAGWGRAVRRQRAGRRRRDAQQ